MSSRLDRLFVLIETGSSPVTRKAASQQLGEVVKYHPQELHHLLNRIFQLLTSSSWDTRIAASQAVEAICQNTPTWSPTNCVQPIQRWNVSKKLRFDGFDIHAVIVNSAPLMASDNLNYSCLTGASDQQLVKKQVEMINSKLNMGISTENIVSDADLSCSIQNTDSNTQIKKLVTEVLELDQMLISPLKDSKMKRKAQSSAIKFDSNNCMNSLSNSDPYVEIQLLELGKDGQKRIKIDDIKVSESTINLGEYELDWPFEAFCTKLKLHLFDPKWETRHGAACALREVMKVHGRVAGYAVGVEKERLEEEHQLWLEDLALHLLCVLGLDRFGDFISDQVVAPVRETCAQCLGVVVNLMSETRVLNVVNLLKCLLNEQEWEIRHGALIGMKYSLVVREDLQDNMLTEVFPLILNCFGDPVDDVSAEAASVLNPVCPKIVRLMPDSVSNLIQQLWKLLWSQDELGVACNSFMTLLASLFMNSDAQSSVSSEMIIKIVPYLWSYLYHNASSVRKSALQTICSMTSSQLCITQWNETILPNTMRHIYQRVLLEPTNDIRLLAEEAWSNIVLSAKSEELERISHQFFGLWLCLTMQSSKFAFDDSLFIFERNKHLSSSEFSNMDNAELKLYVGGNETVSSEIRESNVAQIRCMGCRMLSSLLHKVSEPIANQITEFIESYVDYYCTILLSHLNSKSALQRTVSALVLTEWALLIPNNTHIFPAYVKERLQQCLLESIYYDEIALSYTKILQDTKDYILLLKNNAIPIEENLSNKVLRLNEIENLTNEKTFNKMNKTKLGKKLLQDLQDRRLSIYASVCLVMAEQFTLTTMTQAIIAGAVFTLKNLPAKLNPVIKPLMESIKKEESEFLQNVAATHLARLVVSCCNRDPSPNSKIITNLCTLLCSDLEFTPQIHSQDCKSIGISACSCEKFYGILTLANQQKMSEKSCLLRRMNSGCSNNRSVYRANINQLADDQLMSPDQLLKTNRIQRLGAAQVLIKIVKFIGPEVIQKLPTLWNCMYTRINEIKLQTEKGQDSNAEQLIYSLQIFEVLCPYIHGELLPSITDLLDTLCLILNHDYCAVRHMAARCIAVLAERELVYVMRRLPTLILPFVNAADSVNKRQGGVEAISALVDTLKLQIIPYIVLLVIPLLGRMSDQDYHVRAMASHTFGMLIQLMPLETATPFPPDLPYELTQTVEEQRSFLNQLLNPKFIPDFKMSIDISTSLRSYQQCGVNWLAFLNRYQLHGILCDDMGLGKTLQSLCIVADDHYTRDRQYAADQIVDAVPLPSLVVCPPTLIGHWLYEMEKFIPSKYLNPLQYEGNPSERERLRGTALRHNLIVASYDIVRKDSDFFTSVKWNYCILDEGHIIKNGKTKISRAMKRLVANHRLILSGTPIQNNVLELWSLFDFLMPGYLGNEKQFNTKFSKPIFTSRDPKSSLKEQEAGIIAMETLHQKVLPFILRRMKTDVLSDLPPKITQDYYCELSPIQQMLYEDFSKSKIQKNALHSIQTTKSCNTFSMFQALRYLQSVCNHPKLVLTPQHPLYEEITRRLETENSSLSDIKHAAKLMALKQLLIDCGIGGGSIESDGVIKSGCIVSQHRALIFCQLKAMLNILEIDLLKMHLPNVTYLRLDGSVHLSERHKIVTAFNEDPSIDVLLLTAQIGGLGLNLTGADTVIFVEHDWSPMKDLQAMDRAHRIGQKKVVNVYRLITRATLEQKIMGLQEFKLKTANTIITAENSSLMTMSTEKLLDLFALNAEDNDKEGNQVESSANHSSAAQFMKSLPELWDTKDYDEEFDITTFIGRLQ